MPFTNRDALRRGVFAESLWKSVHIAVQHDISIGCRVYAQLL